MKYQDRRTILAGRCEVDIIAIPGANRVQKSADQAFPFSQDRYFYYLSGIDHPDWTLVIDVKKGEQWLIAPPENKTLAVFEGELEMQEAEDVSGMPALDYASGWEKLRQRLKSGDKVGTLLPRQKTLSRWGLIEPATRQRFLNRLRRHHKGRIFNVAADIADMRMVKDNEEIEEIEAMVNITTAILDDTAARLPHMSYEQDVERYISTQFFEHDVRHNYEPIIACGANAATLHYSSNDKPLQKDSLLLIDVGAQKNYYGADISRTYPLGQPSPFQKQAIEGMHEVQTYLIDWLKPGVTLEEFETEAIEQIGKLLVKLGLIQTNLKRHIRAYYPHSVSHFLGLDVHDVGDYAAQLQPGVVLTVEPGIYSREKGFGIRLEDDIVITSQGARVLGYNRRNN